MSHETYYNRDSEPISKWDWVKLVTTGGPEACAGYTVAGDEINICARFSGIYHGEDAGKPQIWELVINGNPANPAHAAFHGVQELFTDRVTMLDRYAVLNSALDAAKDPE